MNKIRLGPQRAAQLTTVANTHRWTRKSVAFLLWRGNNASFGPRCHSTDPIDRPVDPVVLPAGFIDRLKQMDPKTVAKLLLKRAVCTHLLVGVSSNIGAVQIQLCE